MHADKVLDQAFDEHELWHEFHEQPLEEQQRLLQLTRDNIDYHAFRLDKICESIQGTGQWRSPAAVRKQCLSLESTIDLLEQEKWELRVYEMKEPPAPPPLHVPSNRVSPASRISSRVEIIELGSSSGSESESEAMIIDSVEQESGILLPRQNPQPIQVQDVDSSHKGRNPKSPPCMELTPPPPQPTVRPGSYPDYASYATVSRWDWGELRAKEDRKRIVMKVVQEMSEDDREVLRGRISTVRRANLVDEQGLCVRMMAQGGDEHRTIPGYLHRDVVKMVQFTRVFLCWWLAADYYGKQKKQKPSREALYELEKCLEDSKKDAQAFCDWLHWIFEHTFAREAMEKSRLWEPSQHEIVVISDDDEAPASRNALQE